MKALIAALMLTGAAAQAQPVDPDWPCIQRRISELSVAQVWAGPLPDAEVTAEAEAADIQSLATRISLRRTTLPEAEAAIAEFAAGADAPRLTALFLAAFDQINQTRSRVMAGIVRYARAQAAMEDEINVMRAEFTRLTAAPEPDFDAIDALERDIGWATRIFLDRQQSLTYVCETPVILEQRAFALGRAIAVHLP